MLVDFSPTQIGLADTPSPETFLLIALVAECLDAAVSSQNSIVYIVCAHASVQGEHHPGMDCWCNPEEFTFGVQPFFSIA